VVLTWTCTAESSEVLQVCEEESERRTIAKMADHGYKCYVVQAV